MSLRRILCLAIAGACWLCLATLARSQEEAFFTPRHPYVEIPFEGDFNSTLAGKLLKSLLEQTGKNPALPLHGIPDLNVDRAQVEKLLKQLPEENQKKVLESLLQQERTEAGVQRQDKTGPGASPEPATPGSAAAPAPPSSPAPSRPRGQDDALARWTRELLDQARDSQYGDMVMKSTALRQGMQDLHKLLASGDTDEPRLSAPPQLARWAERLRSSGLVTVPNLRWLKPQALWESQPKLRVPTVDIAPAVPRVALGLPRWGGSGPSGGTLGNGLLWVAFLAVGTLLCWHVLRRWSSAGGRPAGSLRRLGPWPVSPGHVRTPAELILAFEYLSLLRLGPDARSWNHRVIADQLGGRSDGEERLAAEELAFLYERARYAPAADPLATETLASARRNLCLLARIARS